MVKSVEIIFWQTFKSLNIVRNFFLKMDLSLKGIVRSRQVIINDETIPAAVAVSNYGEILAVLKEPDLYIWDSRADEVF